MARVDRLDEELKQVLRTASVIGRSFLYRILRTIEQTVQELDRHLDNLQSMELIREKQEFQNWNISSNMRWCRSRLTKASFCKNAAKFILGSLRRLKPCFLID